MAVALSPAPATSPAVDPLLEALADNGGPTETQALPANSPAVDTADNTGCPQH